MFKTEALSMLKMLFQPDRLIFMKYLDLGPQHDCQEY